MPFDKYSLEFTPEEIKKIEDSLSVLDKTLSPKMLNLTPKEIDIKKGPGKKTQLWRDKILMYLEHRPEMTPRHMDVEEYRKDAAAVKALTAFGKKLRSILEGVEDTAAVLREDLHKKGKDYYEHVKLAAEGEVPGSTTVLKDLEPLFDPRRMGRKNRRQK